MDKNTRFMEVWVPVSDPSDIEVGDPTWYHLTPDKGHVKIGCWAEEYEPGEWTPCADVLPGNQPYESHQRFPAELQAVLHAATWLWAQESLEKLLEEFPRPTMP